MTQSERAELRTRAVNMGVGWPGGAILSLLDDRDALEAEVQKLREHSVSLLYALLDMDHSRGCQGREYACSCDYDDTIYNLAMSFRAVLSSSASREGEDRG